MLVRQPEPETVVSLFFFSCFRDRRDLHSFPTRRSSDLPLRRQRQGIAASRRTVSDGGARGRGSDRSEEHTSELQSRGHLVCRLLLEKKKRRLTAAILLAEPHTAQQ